MRSDAQERNGEIPRHLQGLVDPINRLAALAMSFSYSFSPWLLCLRALSAAIVFLIKTNDTRDYFLRCFSRKASIFFKAVTDSGDVGNLAWKTWGMPS